MEDTYKVTLTNGLTVEVKSSTSPVSDIEYGAALVGELVEDGVVVASWFYVNPRHIVTALKTS